MIARLLISTSIPARIKIIEEELKVNNLTNTHPDIFYFKQGVKLGIDQAKKIKEHFSLKPYSAKGRGVVLEDVSEMTTEAQNALLKTLEELPQNAVFIMGAGSEANILPTVLSRCQIIRIQSSEFRIQNYEVDIEKLIISTTAERFKYVEKLKDKQAFLFSLTSYYHQRLPANADFLNKLLQAEQWAKQNVNIRAILEYLMLVMPSKKC